MERLYIIGSGPGDEAMLTDRAKNVLKTSRRVLNTREMSLAGLMSELKNAEKGTTAVLVSGDCGFFSMAKTMIRAVSDFYEIEVIPGIGSIQYLSAKIKVPYDDAVLFSLHGRSGNMVAKAAYNRKIFALTGRTSVGENSVSDICRKLCRYGLEGVEVVVGERLSYADERITSGKACELKDMVFDGLSVIYIENASAVNPHIPLYDSVFIRGEVPMTKEEIRWLSIQKLGVSPQDVVFDIGAGTGSVSVEMARKAFDGFIYAIESKEGACTLIRENAAKHGAFNIEIVSGEASGVLKGLPKPDKAFIGGSSGNMVSILEKLTAMNPNIKIVANAITIQTLNQIVESFEKYGFTEREIICINIAKSRRLGDYDMMMAQNPVYIITGERTSHV